MTIKDLAAEIRQALSDNSIPLSTIESKAQIGLRLLSEEVALGPHARDLQREDTLTLDGSGTVAVPADFLSGYISRITSANLDPIELEIMKDRAEFSYQICDLFGLAAIEQGTIYTKPTADYGQPVLAGDILATGIIIPTLTNLKTKFEQDLVRLIVGLFAPAKPAKAKGA